MQIFKSRKHSDWLINKGSLESQSNATFEWRKIGGRFEQIFFRDCYDNTRAERQLKVIMTALDRHLKDRGFKLLVAGRGKRPHKARQVSEDKEENSLEERQTRS